VDESGRPVTRARGFWILDPRSARDESTAHRRQAIGITDDLGRLRLPPPPLGLKGYFSIWIETPEGFVTLSSGLYDGFDWTVEEEPLQLQPIDRWFSILVMDTAGSGLPGVTGRLCLSDEGAPLTFYPVLRGDEEGAIEAGPYNYGNYWMDLEAPGKAPIRVCPHQFSEEDAAESWFGPIVLPPGKEVRGRVTVNGLSPTSQAWLRCSYGSTKKYESCSWFLPLTANGEFVTVVRADAPWTLEAGAPGLAPLSRELTHESEVLMDLTTAR